MKKIIITGVTGQDGSLMADYLLKNTKDTIIGGVRRLSVENHKNIQHLKSNPRFKLIDLDITDSHNTDQVIKNLITSLILQPTLLLGQVGRCLIIICKQIVLPSFIN